MVSYKHTQIGYLMLVVTLAVAVLFVWLHVSALAESPSVESGPNLAVSAIMALIIFILTSFATLTVSIDEKYILIKFGYGLFRKKLPLDKIGSVKIVKNRWYYGWGIKMYLWPTTWIFNVSGFDAVELAMKDGQMYRIGTDESAKLESAIAAVIHA
jgi:hypothetical protein